MGRGPTVRKVREPAPARTREDADVRASLLFADAVGDRAIARSAAAVGLDEKMLRRYADPEDRLARVHLGTVLALPVDVAEPLLRACLATLRPRMPLCPTTHILNAGVLFGEVSRELRAAVADGEIDEEEAARPHWSVDTREARGDEPRMQSGRVWIIRRQRFEVRS
jgi:hypothetical protein